MPINLGAFDPQPIAANLPGLQIGQRIGFGGQKSVWHCSYQGTQYVLKVLVADPSSTERAKRELEVYRRCNSPFLPRVGPIPLTSLKVGAEELLYYLEEFIEGTNVWQIGKPMPLSDVVSMGKCIASAIENLWANGFVHRDIKPANIMRRANTQEYILLDVGLALDSSGPSLTQTGGINVFETRCNTNVIGPDGPSRCRCKARSSFAFIDSYPAVYRLGLSTEFVYMWSNDFKSLE